VALACGWRWLQRSALAVALALLPIVALAEAKVVVMVTGDADAGALRTRIAAELALRGFTVVHAEHDAGTVDAIEQVLARAQAERGQLGVLVRVESGGDVRIDVVDRLTGKRLERRTSTRAAHGVSETALAAAELVDASLVEPSLARGSASSEPAAPRALGSPPPPIRHQPRWQADVAVHMSWAIRLGAPIGLAAVALGVRPAPRVGLAAEGSVPLFAQRRTTTIATIRTAPFLAALRADLALLPGTSKLRLDLQAALAALAIRIDVDATQGARAHPQTIWSSAAIAGLTLHKPLGRHVAVGASVRAIVPFENVLVTVNGRTVQRLGGAWIGTGLGVHARW
jgi:hypothetical protein